MPALPEMEPDPDRPCANLPRAHGKPLGTATLRTRVEDFRVDELLDPELSGAGEHLWCLVEKSGVTTADAMRHLCRAAGVAQRDAGCAGLKDRWAVCSQWISLHRPGTDVPEPDELASPGITVLRVARHGRKLRRGMHRGNRFELRLGGAEADPAALAERVEVLRRRGIPNYFGPQRFGRDGHNVRSAQAMFDGRRVRRSERGMLISAARAFLFNAVLAARVAKGSWDRLLPGEAVNLDGSGSVFADDGSPDLSARAARLDLHPTGPLWGRGSRLPTAAAVAVEDAAAAPFEALRAGLESLATVARRPLRVAVPALKAEYDGDALRLTFDLTSGAFATSVCRELFELRDARRPDGDAF